MLLRGVQLPSKPQLPQPLNCQKNANSTAGSQLSTPTRRQLPPNGRRRQRTRGWLGASPFYNPLCAPPLRVTSQLSRSQNCPPHPTAGSQLPPPPPQWPPTIANCQQQYKRQHEESRLGPAPVYGTCTCTAQLKKQPTTSARTPPQNHGRSVPPCAEPNTRCWLAAHSTSKWKSSPDLAPATSLGQWDATHFNGLVP